MKKLIVAIIVAILVVILRTINNILGFLTGSKDLDELRRRIRWKRITEDKTMEIK